MKNGKKYGFLVAALIATPAISLADPIGPLIWNTIPVGVYKLKVPDTNLCLGRTQRNWIGQEAYLSLSVCGDFYPQSLGFVPTAFQNSIVSFRIKNSNQCATVARGVVFGPPSIDMRNCDGINPGSPDFNAAPDQQFKVEMSGNTVIVKTINNKCLSVQGGNFSVGTQIIEENCNSSSAQRFALINDYGALHIEDINAMKAFGWQKVEGASGGANVKTYYRTMPNLNLPSADYNWFATMNDNGAQCAYKCSLDANCKGFTWVNPLVRNGQAMCYLKNAINTPTADNYTNSGFLRN